MKKDDSIGESGTGPSTEGPSELQIRLDIEREHESITFNHGGDIRRVLIIEKDPSPAVHVEMEVTDELKKLREQPKKFVSLNVIKGHHGMVQIVREGMGILIYRMADLISLRSHHFSYDPHLEVLFGAFKSLNIISNDTFGDAFPAYAKIEMHEDELAMVNKLIAEIQAVLKSPEFKKKLADRRKGAKRVRRAFRDMWRRAFAKKPRVLVSRVDLEYPLNGDPEGFHPLFSQQHPDRFLLEVFLADRDRFTNNLRDNQKKGRFAEHLLECGWKLECGAKRGWHLHLVAFFDASRVSSAWYQAEMLGELWVRLTGGRGTYFNPHQGSRDYRYRFIGEVRRGDKDAEAAYEKFVEYVSKDDQIPIVKTSKKLQTFGVTKGKRHDKQ